MAFVKEYKNIREELSEWEYLTKIGVRNMFDEPIEKWTTELVVDRENNYFLIPQGHTGVARSDEDIYYFALCINDEIVNMEVTKQSKGNCTEKNLETFWFIKKIVMPKTWDSNLVSKEDLCMIIQDAFMVKTYNKVATTDCVKTIKVELSEECFVGGEYV